jgi:hypothetical protein
MPRARFEQISQQRRTVLAGEVDGRPVEDADEVWTEAGLVHLDDRLEEGLDELALDCEDVVLEQGRPVLPARVERRQVEGKDGLQLRGESVAVCVADGALQEVEHGDRGRGRGVVDVLPELEDGREDRRRRDVLGNRVEQAVDRRRPAAVGRFEQRRLQERDEQLGEVVAEESRHGRDKGRDALDENRQ